LEDAQNALNVFLAARVAEDAHADRVLTAKPRRRDEAEAASFQRGDDSGVGGFGIAVKSPAKAQDAERGRRGQLERRACGDSLGGRLGEVEAAVDCGAESGDAERPERYPDLERASGARQLQATVGEVHLRLGAPRV